MAIDFYWTLDGDFSQGPDGDLRDTSYSPTRSHWQEARDRIRSDFGDWLFHQDLGSIINRLPGRLNNRATAEEGKASIINALSYGGFIPASIIKVNYIPLTNQWLLYKVTIGNNAELVLQLLYDTKEDNLMIL